MLVTLCQEFSILKYLIGVTLCFTCNWAVGQVNDRDPIGRRALTHNISAEFQDVLPIYNESEKSILDIETSDKEERNSDYHAVFSSLYEFLSQIEYATRNPTTASSISKALNTMKEVEKIEGFPIQESTGSFVSNLLALEDKVLSDENISDEVRSSVMSGVRNFCDSLHRLKKAIGPSVESVLSDFRESLHNLAKAFEPLSGQLVLFTDSNTKKLQNMRRGKEQVDWEVPSKKYIIYERDGAVTMMDNEHIDRKRLNDLSKDKKRSAEDDSELLLLIQTCQRSHNQDDRINGDLAFVGMLQHPTSGKLAREQWVKDQVTVGQAYNFLLIHVKKKNDKFFMDEMGSLWLSYVGYCWEHGHSEFSPIDVLGLIERSELKEKEVVNLVEEARNYVGGQKAVEELQRILLNNVRLQNMAYAMEQNGLDGLIHFAETFTGSSLSETWLSYVAYTFSCSDVEDLDIVAFLSAKKQYTMDMQLELFNTWLRRVGHQEEMDMTGFKDLNRIFKLWQKESDEEALTREYLMRDYIHDLASDMINHIETINEDKFEEYDTLDFAEATNSVTLKRKREE
ncbi:uncharacterized protein PHALS_03217 [Plasmopara halstedii]|uniref:Uncharacterized protein n=1 Tax=Plasmopara halstedii TaxID=4781 RepID=A0A0N7L7B6_PLAHL|nr:uncharacterized protein PHALS_03217 [Plasmopara halstedii]CEG46619.1 hypothetical protein PHALS_03217 [Plasmopara halstedii]|eukprot:XP_024582988.1 hypothetical protein PHALS_03217 [Plasmopara halstedii]